MTDTVKAREAAYFWRLVSAARQLRTRGMFHGPAAADILDDLSAIAVCTTWPALQARVEEAGVQFTEWLEAA